MIKEDIVQRGIKQQRMSDDFFTMKLQIFMIGCLEGLFNNLSRRIKLHPIDILYIRCAPPARHECIGRGTSILIGKDDAVLQQLSTAGWQLFVPH